ncbi:LuxR family two component transcriptional regulator [Knoellia remsis]|uniref:LuxR family two component transcriptional regulator n=1 Tax=Knoellia remsis TaxID=407159 RepID=A0A2T0UZR1_9MICO|nr:response regulator transcription factor [Knoellia remsis]PRY63347.1 LuxR family two component transcriptional regulator [Knoellia remsis]
MTIRVALVDDQALFRAGISMVVGSQDDLEIVGEAGDGSEAVALVESVRPDVVLMDVRMPRVDGVEATRRVVERFGDAGPRVLVLTTFDVDELVADAIEAGASGFVLKETRPELLLAAVRAVAEGTQVVAAGATRAVFERFRERSTSPPGADYERLTPREREILLRAAQGLSNAEIATAEFLSEATVKTHVSRILTKLALRDRVQLVVYAYEHGLL